MATRSYVIPDLDDDNDSSSSNLFSKRLKTDNLSTTKENPTSSSIPLNTINDTESSSNSLFFLNKKKLIYVNFLKSLISSSISINSFIFLTSCSFSSTWKSFIKTSSSSKMGIFRYDIRWC